jgi:hypothetical protein
MISMRIISSAQSVRSGGCAKRFWVTSGSAWLEDSLAQQATASSVQPLDRLRFTVAAKMAFRTAGAATEIVGSLTPPQNSPSGMTTVSTFGIASRRITSQASKLVCSMRPSRTVHLPYSRREMD